MAANCARRSLQQFSTANILNRLSSKAATKLSELASPCKPASASRSSPHYLSSSRLPLQLGGALSLMPLHSVTAAALYTNLLTNSNWGCLSEGFGTTL